MAAMPGELTFSINSKLLAKGVIASDEEVGAAVAFAYRELKLVVEPGGAVGLAALAGRPHRRQRQERRHRALRRQCRRRPVRQAGRLITGLNEAGQSRVLCPVFAGLRAFRVSVARSRRRTNGRRRTNSARCGPRRSALETSAAHAATEVTRRRC